MSIAERTRDTVRKQPFLYEALQAGIVNYTNAARYLDVGDEDAVSAALRRYADELSSEGTVNQLETSARVRMKRGIGLTADGDGLVVVGETAFAPDAGSLTAILATGEIELDATYRVLARCDIAEIDVTAAGFTDEMLVLVVGGRDSSAALRIVEETIEVA